MSGIRFRRAVVVGTCGMAALASITSGAAAASRSSERVRAARVRVDPTEGAPLTTIRVAARGFGAFERVQFVFIDSERGTERILTKLSDQNGSVSGETEVPPDATVGPQRVGARGLTTGLHASTPFTVT